MSTTAENLEKAFELFGPNGEYWIRGAISRLVHDQHICYCAIGALNKAEVGDPQGPKVPAYFLGSTRTVVTWDTYRTTPEVQALLDAAREQLDPDLDGTYDWDNPADAVAEFNDNLENFEQVREWWARAIEIAREREAA